MLLHYITSGLPELDVQGVKQKRMDLFFRDERIGVILSKESIADTLRENPEYSILQLQKLLSNCHYTIMGDVSQNINYETGMNRWEEIRDQVFKGERERFYVLSKSYRNTIEISECAGKILEKASFGAYKITPVIRHGRAVEFHHAKEKMQDMMRKLLGDIAGRRYGTTAIICRDEPEAARARA